MAHAERIAVPSRPRLRPVAISAGLVGLLFGFQVLCLVAIPPLRPIAVGMVPLAIYLLTGVTLAIKAVITPRQRFTWLALLFGLVSVVVGFAYSVLFMDYSQGRPWPHWIDLCRTGFLVLMYLGLLGHVRLRSWQWQVSVRLDGLMITLGITALGAHFVVHPLMALQQGGVLGMLALVQYPLGDVIMLATCIAATALFADRMDRQFWVFLTAIVAVTGSDVTFLFSQLNTLPPAMDYVIQLGSTLGAALLSMAAAIGSRRFLQAERPDTTGRHWISMVQLPALTALTCLMILAPLPNWHPTELARWLAIAGLACVAVRSLATVREIAILMRARDESMQDGLTGLLNRSGLYQNIGKRLADFDEQTASEDTVALLLLDLNEFKEVNDSLGHHAGDKLLVKVADRLRTLDLSPNSTTSRLGGDEFAIFLPGGSQASAAQVAEEIHALVAEPIEVEDVQVLMSGSIGINVADPAQVTPSELLRGADIAMYEAKSKSLPHTVYDGAGDRDDRLRRTADLRRGMDHNEIEVFFQPKLELQSNQVTGAEALVRWRHPEHGIQAPDSFLPIAANAGLMPRITDLVLQESIAGWPGGRPLEPPCPSR